MTRACLLAIIALVLVPASAGASTYTFGIGDRADASATATRSLGARVYRVVIDPARPLASYDAQIYAHRRVGQEPQIVIGGTGTTHHASQKGIVATAVAAVQRWPYVYSVSVVNEPDLSGMAVCTYARTYRQAAAAMHVLGKRILFGEFSSHGTLSWTRAILRRCGRTVIKNFAWHAYDADPRQEGAINNTANVRKTLHDLLGYTPSLYITEYGIITRGPNAVATENASTSHWKRALRQVRQNGVREIVAWGVHEAPPGSTWDSRLIQANGRKTPAYRMLAARKR